jgi:hypothetical protein
MYKANSSNKCQQIPASVQTGLYKKNTPFRQTSARRSKLTNHNENSEYKFIRGIVAFMRGVG